MRAGRPGGHGQGQIHRDERGGAVNRAGHGALRHNLLKSVNTTRYDDGRQSVLGEHTTSPRTGRCSRLWRVSGAASPRDMIPPMTKATLLLTPAVLLLACSTTPAQQPAAIAGPNDIAARVGDRSIAVRELDEKWKATAAAQHAEAVQALYDGRRQALEAIIADMLVAVEAKKQGMSPDAYIEAELSKRVKPVGQADVVTFYQANLNQMQGRSLEQMTPAINRYLSDQQRETGRQALLAELKKAGPAIRVSLEAPRAEVPIAASDPATGPASAPVTLIEFSDFQCPFCQRVEPTLKELRTKYGDKLRIVWKDFPLTQIHPQAFKAGEAGHCAGDQGKYWEFHDRLFANQQALMPADLKKHAADLGLDAASFGTCLDSSKYGERVRDGVALGDRLGVNSTPTIFINGRRFSGAQPLDVFVAAIDEELARGR
jgi:protein-disulfide isomerase